MFVLNFISICTIQCHSLFCLQQHSSVHNRLQNVEDDGISFEILLTLSILVVTVAKKISLHAWH
jgi:hypothetical protein